MSPQTAAKTIETIVRGEWGRLVSSLIRVVGDFQLAEDSLQDALVSALDHWQRNGVPNSPAGWLLQVARRKAIDRIRRSQNFERKQSEYALLLELENESSYDMEEHEIPDERLRLVFTCCHPALEEKSRVALTLKTMGGLQTSEIAKAFLDKEETMAQRLVRAKRKIKLAGIPYEVPEKEQWTERLNSVLGVLYLIFNEGYSASTGEMQIRVDLCDDAIRLTRAINKLKPEEPEIEGLLALMLLHDSRRTARTDANGAIIPLEDQDRSRWDIQKIEEGINLTKQALGRGRSGPYQIQAAISAVHAEAPSYADTGWQEIVLLYDALYALQPNPVVLVNKAVAVSYAQTPNDALLIVDALTDELDSYYPLHAARADFLRRAGEFSDASSAYQSAIKLTRNPREREFLENRLKSVLN